MNKDPALEERHIAAKEKQAEQDERKNDIAERALDVEEAKSRRHFHGMITMAVIGFGGAIFGTLYVDAEKDKDLAALHEKIDHLSKNDCDTALAQQRLSYDGNMCMKLVMAQRKTWAACEVLKNQE